MSRSESDKFGTAISTIGLAVLVVGTIVGVLALPRLAGARPPAQAEAAAASVPRELPYQVFLPLVQGTGCDSTTGETYGALAPLPPPADRPAEQHADLNLALRSYASTNDYLGLVDINGPTDPNAPQLYGLFSDNRTPTFSRVYRVYDWDWGCNCRGNLIGYPPVTLAGMTTAPGEPVRLPGSGYNIGTRFQVPPRGYFIDSAESAGHYEALVLYAATDRITLKYTLEDNVIEGYTIHVENVCVSADLLQLYRDLNTAGRSMLPALKAGQTFGRAQGAELGAAIRDSGSFMDPRSRKDWWQGR